MLSGCHGGRMKCSFFHSQIWFITRPSGRHCYKIVGKIQFWDSRIEVGFTKARVASKICYYAKLLLHSMFNVLRNNKLKVEKNKTYKEFRCEIWLKFWKISLFYFHVIENHWNEVWFRTYLLLLNKHFVRRLRATRAREHFELCTQKTSLTQLSRNISYTCRYQSLYFVYTL